MEETRQENPIDRPKVGLGIIVMKEPNQVLLGLRKGSHEAGKWAFPGGHLEKFEQFHEGVLNELKEETGLIPPKVRLVDFHSPCAVTNDFLKEDDKHYITLYFRACHFYGEPELREPNRCEEWRWFDWNELPSGLMVGLSGLKERDYNPFLKPY